jgi:hypothetical protein
MAIIGEFDVAARSRSEPQDQFIFCGETFTVGRIGLVPLGRFAKAAMSGLDSAEMEGLAVIIDLLAQIVIDEDQDRFLDVASRNRADGDDLMPIVQALIEAQAGRPTQRPSDLSGGSLPTTESSREPSSSEASLSPIMRDERVRALRPVSEAGQDIAQTG